MYTINTPVVELSGEKARVRVCVDVDGEKRNVWFSFDEHYVPYLTIDRCDAFVTMLLYTAMRDGHDIQCELPISERLLYQLDNTFLDAAHQCDPAFHRTKILCPITREIYPMGEAVATSMSRGVDSFTSVYTHSLPHNRFEDYNVNLLCTFSVGQFNAEDGTLSMDEERFASFRKGAEDAAASCGFPLLFVESNIGQLFHCKHIKQHIFRDGGTILMFQKLFKAYIYASGELLMNMGWRGLSDNDSYDCVLLPCLCTENTLFVSGNPNATRLDKLRLIKDFEPAQKHLRVCSQNALRNCGRCDKCIRTLAALDAVEGLENYSSVFDIDQYKAHRAFNIALVITMRRNTAYEGIEAVLRQNGAIPFKARLLAIPVSVMVWVYNLVESRFSWKAKQRVRKLMAALHIKTPF